MENNGIYGSAMEQTILTPLGSAPQTTTNVYAPNETTKSPFEMELEREDIQAGIMTYEKMRPKLTALKAQWADEILETERRRDIRKINIDVNKLRYDEKIAQDDVLIPIRLADMNITRQSVTFVNYFTQSWRAGMFVPQQNPAMQVDTIEEEFTRVYRYKGWEVAYYAVVDGTQAHGWDSVELVRDKDKPGGFAFRHIGHDKLLFPRCCTDIQTAECLAVVYEVPGAKLLEFVKKFGFDESQVRIALGSWYESTMPGAPEAVEPTVKIAKCYYRNRDTGIIYMGWYSYEQMDCTDWLKAPVPLYIGVNRVETRQQAVPATDELGIPMMDPMTQQPMMTMQPQQVILPEFETSYPIFLLPYRITEEPMIKSQIGRIFMDEPKQDAMTTLWSSTITGMSRASNIYASVKNPNQNGNGKPEMLDVEIQPNGVYSQPLDFFTPPYPDPVMFKALQALEQQNAADTNQIAWGVNNRQDSRKTAKEVGAAEQQNTEINNMDLVVFSLFESAMLNAAYRVAKSAAMTDGKPFLNNVAPEQKQEMLAEPYDINAPGSIDVVKRNADIQKISSLLPQLNGTDLGMIMFADLLTLMFPKKGPMYAAVAQMQFMQAQQGQQLMQQMGTLLAKLVQQFGRQMPPEELTAATQMLQVMGGMQQQRQTTMSSASAGKMPSQQ